MKVVVVESPAKAKTINKYLGPDYEVLASFGHIRDLPAKDGSVDPDSDFAMVWQLEDRGAKRVADIARAVKGADKLILATDPDREGEAISWHVIEALAQKKLLKDLPIERVTFNAITRDAVADAMAHPRQIDQALVDAYLARRALDYLVGFNLSPVLWRKLPGARSAGRVQSVALRLVCDREREIETFVAREYWSLIAVLATREGATFEARLVGADGRKITRLDIGKGEEAQAFKDALETAAFTVANIEAKPARRHPQPPFTTSTLQQEASRKLGFAPARTMQLAQRLYEGTEIGGETVGLITYMRTDGVDMAPEAVSATRAVIGRTFGDAYVPDAPRKYSTKAKNAQEAHEAIRPTDPGRAPDAVARYLDPEQAKLYELIWTRTLASQMESARLERTTADITAQVGARVLDLRATGQVVVFDGFLRLYQEGRDDDADEDGGRLPAMKAGDSLDKREIRATQHFTEPPPRFTEASLVKRMEELGIGRPSTYAAVLAVLRDREYVRLDKKRLVPEDKGRIVTAFLESFFSRYVEYDFTADLEEKLDRVSNHEIDWKEVLRDFWRDFIAAIEGTRELRMTQVIDSLNDVLAPRIFPARADGGDPRACPACNSGRLSLKIGKFGAFIGCSNYPECRYTRQLSGDGEGGGGDGGPRVLGTDPETGLEVSLRDGRYGPYVQLGGDAPEAPEAPETPEASSGDVPKKGRKTKATPKEKPKRQTLPREFAPDNVDLDIALKLLSLPRTVATHPESGNPIKAGIGRFGPYVQHDKTYASLGKDDSVLEIGANRAIDLIIAKEQGGGRRGGSSDPGKVLGEEPETGKTLSLKAGRYGPYVTDGTTNATLPKGVEADSYTLEEAVALIRARRVAGKKKPPAKKAPAKTAAEKEPAGKAAASKTTAGTARKTTARKTAASKTAANTESDAEPDAAKPAKAARSRTAKKATAGE
ncbi:type I DNA topoisomerase [Pseudochelatococcus lubricantis]|uniref:type I DNA topoisomerase n=1 Tax=Pseudochelatococcus lubricantis TaxID=1538102 RepID=UPI0035EB773E